MSNSLLAILPTLSVIALVITAVGFRRMVYFLNIGYAFSIVAVAVVSAIMLRANATLLTVLLGTGIVFWGLRLGVFVTRRELSAGYKKERDRIDKEYGKITLPIKFAIWISVSVLYLMMVSPLLFSLEAPATGSTVATVFQIIGLVLMVGGLVLEGIADKQKSAFKAKNPSEFCDTGLYSLIRCPNYLGEITFWIGTWVMGIGFYKTALEWIISLIGMVCIVYIMFGSTKRLEKTQISRYGNLAEFQQYSKSVPILIPWLPLYTLQNTKTGSK
jgi:steroid 5-alpha reductase family enzyme